MACPHMKAETLFRSYCLAYDPQSAVVPATDRAFEQLRGFGEGDVRWMGHRHQTILLGWCGSLAQPSAPGSF